MRTKRNLAIATALFVAAAGPVLAQGGGKKGPGGPGLTLTTTAFQDGSEIPAKYTQADQHPISPKLEWSHVPPNTQSFALILHDPDVALMKTTNDVLHWMIFNIPGTATELPENMPDTATMPDGAIQAKNLRGGVGYMGPGAPPPGPYHHYTFELFALDTKLDLGPNATRDEVIKAMEGHILGKGVLVGRFHR